MRVIIMDDSGKTTEYSSANGDHVKVTETKTYAGRIDKPQPINYVQVMIVPVEQPTVLQKG